MYQTDDFFDDESTVNDLPPYYMEARNQNSSQAYFENTNKSNGRYTNATLGGFLSNYGGAESVDGRADNRQTNATLGGFLSNYGGTESNSGMVNNRQTNATLGNVLSGYEEESDSSMNYAPTAPKFERQVANLTYVDAPAPFYDPSQSEVMHKVPDTSRMMTPVIVNLEGNPLPANTTNNIFTPNIEQKREKRIKELKMEINDLDKSIEMDGKKSRRNFKCCCCPTTRQGKLIVFIVFVLIVAALALLGYFLWPKVPQFKVSSLQTYPDVIPTLIQTSDSFSLIYALNLTVNVTNENRYGIRTDAIFMRAYISPNMTALRQTKYPGSVVTGKVDDHLVGVTNDTSRFFGPRRMTTVYFNLSIAFYPDPQYGLLSDPTVGDLLRVCSKEGRAKKLQLKILYEVEVKIGILSRFGFTPRITDEVDVGCPLGAVTADNISKKYEEILADSTQM